MITSGVAPATGPIPDELLAALRQARSLLLTTHRSPDGDAVGSTIAASRLLRGIGKKAHAWIPDGVPRFFGFMPGAGAITSGDAPAGHFDATLVLDTGDPSLLGKPLPGAGACGRILVLDHHLVGDPWGDIVVRRPACATGELVWELARRLGWDPDLEFATGVYVAIATDTGMFRYDLTSPAAHTIAASCLRLGVRPHEVSRHVYENYPASWIQLWAELLSHLQVDLGGRFATLTVPEDLLARHGAGEDALEEVIAYPRGITGVEVAALVRRKPSGKVRISLRSNGRIDVSALARHFGGGGHHGAAGCDMPPGTDLAAARRALAERVERMLAEAGGEA